MELKFWLMPLSLLFVCLILSSYIHVSLPLIYAQSLFQPRLNKGKKRKYNLILTLGTYEISEYYNIYSVCLE